MGLQDRVKKLSNQLELMENREKGNLEDLINSVVTVKDFGFLVDEKNNNYVVFTIEEDPTHFYFGGKVLTEDLEELQQDGYLQEIQEQGLPILLEKQMSKNKREYTKVTYYPN